MPIESITETSQEQLDSEVVSSATGRGRSQLDSGQVSTAGDARTTEDRKELHDRTKRIQEIMERVERLPNEAVKGLLRDCLESLLALYGEGLGRIMNILGQAGASAQGVKESVVRDPLVRGLLLIHGLHPRTLEERLRAALDQVRPYMESHGGSVDLIGINGDFARLRLAGSCKSCPSSRVTLELAVRKALEENCPDLAGFEVETPA